MKQIIKVKFGFRSKRQFLFKFSFKLSAPLKKKTKVTVQVTKKGYKKLVKVYKFR